MSASPNCASEDLTMAIETSTPAPGSDSRTSHLSGLFRADGRSRRIAYGARRWVLLPTVGLLTACGSTAVANTVATPTAPPAISALNPATHTTAAPAPTAAPTALPTAPPTAPPTARPTPAPTAPPAAPPAQQPASSGFDHNAAYAAGASAICNDGSWSYSAHRSGTCSYHDGVNWWTGNLGPAGPG
jgi:hypothetical protein